MGKQLHWAAEGGDFVVTKALLHRFDSRIDVNASCLGRTALHYCDATERILALVEVAKILIKFGASLNVTTSTGDTPLTCKRSGNVVITKILAKLVYEESGQRNAPMQ